MAEIFTIPANSRVPVGFPARYLFIEDISVPGAEIEIEGYGDLGGERFSFAETLTEGASLSGFPITINDWYFKNTSGVDLTVTIKAGLVYYQKNEFSGVVSGDVNALTTEKNKTIDGAEYFYGYQRQADAAYASMIALVNPAGSNVNLRLDKIHHNSSSSNHRLGIFTEVDFLTNSVTDHTATHKLLGGRINKKASGLNPAGRVYEGVKDGVMVNGSLIELPTSSLGKHEYDLKGSPFVIEEGYAVAIWGRTVNLTISVLFEWGEYSNA